MAVKKFVDSAISDNKVVVFSKTWCPYCKKAKSLFATSYPNVEITIFELDERDDGDQIQDYLLEKSGQRTVPNIFINQEHIGGSSDLITLENRGGLAQKLTA